MPAKKTPRKKKKAKKSAARKKTAIKKAAKRKTPAKKKAVRKKAKAKAPAKRRITPKKKVASRKPARKKSRSVKTEPFPQDTPIRRAGGHSSDLQGISLVEGADSESVNELLEEGNTFEAGAVAGVEEADDSDEKEVRTHEVPEDDVPGEYLDED
jgi:hypothetical protein